MKKLLWIIILILICSELKADTTKVLFVGNSYTYVNDLPLMFKNLSASLGKNVYTDMSAPGGYSFGQHLSNTETLNKISRGGWNYVVLRTKSDACHRVLQVFLYIPFRTET